MNLNNHNQDLSFQKEVAQECLAIAIVKKVQTETTMFQVLKSSKDLYI